MKPTIDIYLGSPIQISSEEHFLSRLVSDLNDQGENSLIFANFFAGKTAIQVDFLIITSRCACHVELKNYTAPVIGAANGAWQLILPDGESSPLGERQNPYAQALSGKFAISDVMHTLAARQPSVPPPPVGKKFFKSIDSVVCIYPDLLPGSQVPSDHKVFVMGYTRLLDHLLSHEKNPGWSKENWIALAMEFQLTRHVQEDEGELEVASARKAIQDYEHRLKDYYSRDLHHLVETTVETNGRTIGSVELLDFLSTGRNASFVGASGVGKTHLSKHMLLRAIDRGWLPILIKAKNFDGKLSKLLDRSIAHLHPSSSSNLFAAAKALGQPIVLVVDGYNECPEAMKPVLLETLQAFCLRRPFPIVMSSQTKIALPQKLEGEEFLFTDLTTKEKLAVFESYSCKHLSKDEMETLTEAFRTPYEISLAAECIPERGHKISRSELFDSYVRRRCASTSSPAAARQVLSEIAYAMAQQFVTSLPASECIAIAERSLSNTSVPVTLLDEIIASGLLDIAQEFWSFRHELIGQFFGAMAMNRKYESSEALSKELSRPRNRNLAEFTIHFLNDSSWIRDCLVALADPEIIYACLRGRIGTTAEGIANREVLRMITMISDDISELRFETKLFPAGEREGYPVIEITQGSLWTKYDKALMAASGFALSDGCFVPEISQFFERLDSVMHHKLIDSTNNHISKRWQSLLFQRLYIDSFVNSRITLASSIIINACRNRTWQNRDLRIPDNILGLLNAGGEQVPPVLYLLCLLLPQYRQNDQILAGLPPLLEWSWQTGIYHLQLEALEAIGHFGNMLEGSSREAIVAILGSLKSQNIFLNNSIIETLCCYDLLEPLVDSEQVKRELDEILAIPGDPKAQEQAYSTVSNIFEDVFGNAYFEGIHELIPARRTQLYVMASQGAPADGLFADWILERLLESNDPGTLLALQRFAENIDCDSGFIQQTVRCYELGVIGCARFAETPPRLETLDSNDRLAWQAYGEIIFWTSKLGFDHSDLSRICGPLWQSLCNELVIEAVDPLMRMHSSNLRVSNEKRSTGRLFVHFREPIREILTFGLAHLDKLTTLFARGGSATDDHARFVITALGDVGNQDTIRLLESFVESPELGRLAIGSIRQLKRI